MRKTPSNNSPKNSKRGCLCKDSTYSTKCCDGSLQAQGIGVIVRTEFYIIAENRDVLLSESNERIILEV